MFQTKSVDRKFFIIDFFRLVNAVEMRMMAKVEPVEPLYFT